MTLSIIIVNFNTYRLTLNCLQSIYNQVDIDDFEVILVDNASIDNSVELIQQKYPQVKIIQNTKNYGFGKANNQGIKKASGSWLMLLNSDTILPQGTLVQLLTYIKDENNSVIGIKTLNKDDSIQPSAGFFPTLFRLFNQMFFIDDLPGIKKILKPYQQNNLAFYQRNQIVDWVMGSCMLIPKKYYELVGGFDEQIFMYGEEVDLCYRLQKKGLEIKYLTSPYIYHLKGASSKDGFNSAIIGEYKGLITFYRKHFPNKLSSLKFILWCGALLRAILFAMISPKKVDAYKKALKVIYL